MAESPSILVIGPRWVGDMVMAQCLFIGAEATPSRRSDRRAWRRLMGSAAARPDAGSSRPDRRALLPQEARIRRCAGKLGPLVERPIRPCLSSCREAGSRRWCRSSPVSAPRRLSARNALRSAQRHRCPCRKRSSARRSQAFFGLARGGTFQPPRLTVDKQNQRALCARFGLSEGNFVALMPGAEFGPAKRWPTEKYAEFARRAHVERRFRWCCSALRMTRR